MKIIFRPMKRAVLPLLLALFSPASNADVGNLGGVALTALTIFAALWSSATLALFWLLRRKLSLVKRIHWSTLFLFSPAILLALAILASFAKKYVFGDGDIYKSESTREPLAVYGVVFPPGSRIDYVQTGGFFGWHAERTLEHIRSPHPVPLGNLYIDGFMFMRQNSGNTIRLMLSDGQTVDSWPCSSDTTVDIKHGSPRLSSCFLAAPHMWHGELMPEGAYVMPDGANCVWVGSAHIC
jgi:hypothetical protein